MATFSDFTDIRYLKNNKIRVILHQNNMNASQFADAIKVQRSTISHILAYRNRPSHDILEKIVAWNEKYNLEWFRTQSPEEAQIITQLIENQGYGGAKVSNVTTPDLRERNHITKVSNSAESRTAQNKPEVTANHSLEQLKPRRAVLITIVYDDGSSQVIPVDPNSKFNQFLGQ
ncbi:helix-turn-helix transcriptional regulator [Runella aurantiaca]|uniref:XRE family transcriptional regulator n=1 Tax=Runella aurantiaca TaxID=2282308 RepID=A0A369I9F6_9BACT|nr:helix-turn-helix transcriptional regulator [Runella aurantiaca]RDB03286.1 XRE family transcriptional regulator [Runella aurantiaca]